MPKSQQKSSRINFDTVSEIAREFAGAEEGTSYGTPAFKVHGQLFVRLKEDNETLVVRTEMERREAMIAENPEVYYLTDHYLDYPWILVRLSNVKKDALRDLMEAAWKLAIQSKPVKKSRRM